MTPQQKTERLVTWALRYPGFLTSTARLALVALAHGSVDGSVLQPSAGHLAVNLPLPGVSNRRMLELLRELEAAGALTLKIHRDRSVSIQLNAEEV